MALVNHVQLVINVQQLQIYQSHVKQENIGRIEINKYIFIEISVDICLLDWYSSKFSVCYQNI